MTIEQHDVLLTHALLKQCSQRSPPQIVEQFTRHVRLLASRIPGSPNIFDGMACPMENGWAMSLVPAAAEANIKRIGQGE
jgi:hypothetical protein